MSDRKFRTLLPNTDRRPQSRERNEELRVIRGTRGKPGTVAPFRAWRGSRDLVAQSPKFHAPAVARVRASAGKILTHSFAGMAQGSPRALRLLRSISPVALFQASSFRNLQPGSLGL